MAKPDAKKLLIDFLAKENRPFTANDVFERCGKDIGKANVQKTLDLLVSKEEICSKSFGKTKLYFAQQKLELSQLKTDLQNCIKKLTQSQNDLKNKQKQWRELETKLKSIQNVRSLQTLEEERGNLLDEIRQLNEKLRRQKANAAETKLTPADAKKIEKRYDFVTGTYRKRKRICADMLDAILEGYPKSKKALIEDIGLETDEEMGFTLEVQK